MDNPAPPPKLNLGAYGEKHPDAERRLLQIMRSDDPQVRRLAQAYADALRQREAQRAARLKQLYRLTDAEARVALHFIDGGAVASCAEAFSVGVGTVRTQLKSIYAKTGVNRQAALVRLGASLD